MMASKKINNAAIIENSDGEEEVEEVEEVEEESDDSYYSEDFEAGTPRGGGGVGGLGAGTGDGGVFGASAIRNPVSIARGPLNLSEIEVSGNYDDETFESASMSSVNITPKQSDNKSTRAAATATNYSAANNNSSKNSNNNNKSNNNKNSSSNKSISSNSNNNRVLPSSMNNSLDVDNAYSFDFEESQNSTSKAVKFASASSEMKASSSVPYKNANSISLVVAASSVNQAEVIVDELGKEVARLRNSQKMILQQRRQTALDKKTRADNRRSQYMRETEDFKARISQLERTNEGLVSQVELGQSALEVSKSNHDALRKNRDLLKEEYQNLKDTWHLLTEDNRRLLVKVEDEKQNVISIRGEMTNLKDNYDRELSKFKALLEISHKSMESLEARMIKEREKLPEYQETQLRERELRLRFLEDQIYAREINWNAEEARRTKVIDTMRQDAIVEMQEIRKRAEEERNQFRIALEVRKKEADEAELKYNIKFIEQNSLLDKRFAELSAREKQLDEQERKAERRMIELAAYEKIAEPTIRSIKMEENSLLILKKEVEEKSLVLHEKQKSLFKYESELRIMDENHLQISRVLDEEKASLSKEKKILKELALKYDLLNRETQKQKMELYEKTIVIKEKSYSLQKLMMKSSSSAVAAAVNGEGGKKQQKHNLGDMQIVSREKGEEGDDDDEEDDEAQINSRSMPHSSSSSHSSADLFPTSGGMSNYVISDILKSCEHILDRITPGNEAIHMPDNIPSSSQGYFMDEKRGSNGSDKLSSLATTTSHSSISPHFNSLSIESKFMSTLQGSPYMTSSASSSSKHSPSSETFPAGSLEFKASCLLSPTATEELRSFSQPIEQSNAKLDSFLKRINY